MSFETSATSPKLNWRDYYEMCKPNVVLLMLLTSLVGMFMAVPGMVPWDVLVWGNLGIAMTAASAAVVNHVIDRRIDGQMGRTHNRPVAKGKVEPIHALIFAAVLAVVGIGVLYVFINSLTAWLTLASSVGYALVYTLYLKRATPQNIVIGGIAGAMPPLLGWAAVTGTVDPNALLLVLIIYTWTPPHFWALAIHKRDEYAKVEVPMLPVTHGLEFTGLQVLLYTVLLVISTMLPYVVGMSGFIYLVGVTVLNVRFLYWAWKLYRGAYQQAMKTFWFSIIYLMVLFVLLLVDHYLPI
ncbi:MAG: protoheme IX farnesyltransferase [Oceanospirillaceae bacterium]|jgi:protoheme IX farnesyltransferase|nr:protoheme IX farnesyltransferase [Oceanospirillaceae bacterium]MBT4442065.1 protoheme IX farnesyltransferase [Oceanospirillaceae bacterium]MBT6077165.1 protoheme IX farnesyltransferase [Oceanospirillaceae bacterium]MBT7329935.1 protoheme IX farnesyltransferase [Oceanospirillaceae bacterium]